MVQRTLFRSTYKRVPGQGLSMLVIGTTRKAWLWPLLELFLLAEKNYTKSLPNICRKRKSLDINYSSKHVSKTIKKIKKNQYHPRSLSIDKLYQHRAVIDSLLTSAQSQPISAHSLNEFKSYQR